MEQGLEEGIEALARSGLLHLGARISPARAAEAWLAVKIRTGKKSRPRNRRQKVSDWAAAAPSSRIS
jgi:hypothetical protein